MPCVPCWTLEHRRLEAGGLFKLVDVVPEFVADRPLDSAGLVGQ